MVELIAQGKPAVRVISDCWHQAAQSTATAVAAKTAAAAVAAKTAAAAAGAANRAAMERMSAFAHRRCNCRRRNVTGTETTFMLKMFESRQEAFLTRSNQNFVLFFVFLIKTCIDASLELGGRFERIPAAMVRRFKDTGVQVPDAGAEVPDIGPEPEAEDRAAVDLEKATSPSVTSATKFASSECMVRLQNDYRQLRREVQTLHSRLDAAHLVEPEAHRELEQRLAAVEKRIPPESSLFSSEAGVGSGAMTPTPMTSLPGLGSPSQPRSASKQPRSASKQPVDFCVKSSRWRECRGRFCRAPSPARC